MARITTLGFDADDTLWHHERYYKLTEQRFQDLLTPYARADHLSDRLLAAERRNLSIYGYGVKGFTLSMIETAIEVTEARVPATVIAGILGAAREMLAHPIETLPGVRETLTTLCATHRLVLITKGDLFDQERKLAQSGLGALFTGVEIISEKDAAAYQRIFARYGDGPERAAMIGNSVKSDILPALAAGSFAVHVPHEINWVLDHAEDPVDTARFRRIADLGALAGVLEEFEQTLGGTLT